MPAAPAHVRVRATCMLAVLGAAPGVHAGPRHTTPEHALRIPERRQLPDVPQMSRWFATWPFGGTRVSVCRGSRTGRRARRRARQAVLPRLATGLASPVSGKDADAPVFRVLSYHVLVAGLRLPHVLPRQLRYCRCRPRAGAFVPTSHARKQTRRGEASWGGIENGRPLRRPRRCGRPCPVSPRPVRGRELRPPRPAPARTPCTLVISSQALTTQ